jgi:hypothetical protein
MPDGGLAEVYAVCPDVSDAGEAFELDGGTWLLPPPRGPHLACRLAGCEAYVAGIEAPVPTFSAETWALVAILGALSLLGGLYGGWSLGRLFGR